MQCSYCAAELPEDDRFCEACGKPLASGAEPRACVCGAGAGEINEDGFCEQCGRRARRPPTDHMESTISPVCAAVSDRGLLHPHNEDRFEIRQWGKGLALVVCDGVSSSKGSDAAAATAAECIAEYLADAMRDGPIGDPVLTVRLAIASAEAALVERAPQVLMDDAPSTTVVAALVTDDVATVGWVGDSRAYWIGPDGARQLTSDHSWMNNVVSSGKLTAEEAERNPQAHAITRWLGADAGDNAEPDTARFPMRPPGVLLLCTDGLWNYAPTPGALAKAVEEAGANGADALAAARNLAAFANAQGGHDNVTAVVLRLPQGD